jgi:hypothetical protein
LASLPKQQDDLKLQPRLPWQGARQGKDTLSVFSLIRLAHLSYSGFDKHIRWHPCRSSRMISSSSLAFHGKALAGEKTRQETPE